MANLARPCGLLKFVATTQSTIWFRGTSYILKLQFWNVELVVWLPSKKVYVTIYCKVFVKFERMASAAMP